MPKKHFTDYTKQAQASQTRGIPAPKAQNGAGASSSSSSTVNQRLEQLRREQTPKATVEQRNAVSTIVSSPTVPPNLRHLLAIPETEPSRPPRGQAHLRAQDGALRRVPPGPATPLSWLHTSRHAPRNLRTGSGEKYAKRSTSGSGIRRARGRYNLGVMDASLPGLARPGSLMDTAMQTMARNWDWLVEYEQFNLATLPVALKGMLLSYLSLCGPGDGIGIQGLKTLFLSDSELDGGTGSKELEILDLSGMVGYPDSIGLNDLNRYWVSSSSARGTSTHDSTANNASEDEPPESWEDATGSDSLSGKAIIPKALASRFPQLTALSLSNPSSSVSWSHLLNFSVHLGTLTHLSLANWPVPSLTPNAKTAFVESRQGNVSLGGSHIYSAMDDDWHEAASILRRLSNNTYCLRYLDLEGCNEWLPALIWNEEDVASDQWATDRLERLALGPRNRGHRPAKITQRSLEGPGWNTSWAQLAHINVAQGWIPTDTAAVRALPSGSLQIQLLNYLRRTSTSSESRKQEKAARIWSNVKGPELQAYQVKRWLEKEKEMRRIAGTVRALRSSAAGKWIEFEHGWSPNGVSKEQADNEPDIAVAASRRAMNAGGEA